MNSISEILETLQKEYAGQKGAVEFSDPYKVLFATIISQRNKDELTEKVAQKLFQIYPTTEKLSQATPKQIAKTIYPTGFYNVKGKIMVASAKKIMQKYNGKVPKDIPNLTSLPGVGRKTANCVLVYGYGTPAIIVDTHVHRISQRLGWLKSRSPEETEKKLRSIVPKKYWKTLNTILVLHGRSICSPIRPKCWDCPILGYCHYGKGGVKKLGLRR